MSGPRTDDAQCWQCGALADTGCAYSLALVAHAERQLDAHGYPVKRGKPQDQLEVRVPRCAWCRGRNRSTVLIILGGAVAGAIVFPILQSRFWPRFQISWLRQSHEGIGGITTGIGVVIGFVIAALCVFLHRKLSRLRGMNSYPPVVMLRQAGWDYPS